MKTLVSYVLGVRHHPNSNLTIVSVFNADGVLPHQVIANLQDDGTPRWKTDEVCVYVSENSIVPEDVLKERGYWEEGSKKGMLGGSKGNRVKGRVMGKDENGENGVESRGLIFKVGEYNSGSPTLDHFVTRGLEKCTCNIGDDVTNFFGITEYVEA
jgi:hypothetical protein